MIKTTLALALAATCALAAPSSCNQDNCLRALLAPARPAAADCSSYLVKTTTPAAATVTAVVTSSTAPQSTPAPSAVSATIPTYASACSGVVRYTSACSCVGVTATTVTAVTPTVTVTVTSTTPSSTSCPKTNIKLKAVGGAYNGQYAQLINNYSGKTVVFVDTLASATSFNIDSANHISAVGTGDLLYGSTVNYYTAASLQFSTVAKIFQYGNSGYATFDLGSDNKITVTSAANLNVVQTCGNVYDAGAGVTVYDKLVTDRGEDTTPCFLFDFYAVC
ncbi:hypothetical protein GLAREA_00614 [Glarea lozoyensis ATCC 20868]|uniref:Pectin lyase-like protein n=1 Tax=Glarea lozoyensis (strain ATCC 20868 / MF5171) TaxID=1116229 RepID=S3CWX8_GLAL2|nr:uncharacterized protein GLAREA_00614 [Glarea lozoyensis ATCC 20868]EPE29454.1 hypothetical protein GLAREA_00614 [Glarea lozoyensis ATCC 20868]